MSASGLRVRCRLCGTKLSIGFNGECRLLKCRCELVVVEIGTDVAQVFELQPNIAVTEKDT